MLRDRMLVGNGRFVVATHKNTYVWFVTQAWTNSVSSRRYVSATTFEAFWPSAHVFPVVGATAQMEADEEEADDDGICRLDGVILKEVSSDEWLHLQFDAFDQQWSIMHLCTEEVVQLPQPIGSWLLGCCDGVAFLCDSDCEATECVVEDVLDNRVFVSADDDSTLAIEFGPSSASPGLRWFHSCWREYIHVDLSVAVGPLRTDQEFSVTMFGYCREGARFFWHSRVRTLSYLAMDIANHDHANVCHVLDIVYM